MVLGAALTSHQLPDLAENAREPNPNLWGSAEPQVGQRFSQGWRRTYGVQTFLSREMRFC